MTDTLTQKSVEMMHNLGIKTITVTTNEFDDLVKGSKVQKNWIEALKKLAIFKLYDFEHLVFLDCDTYMTQNMDHIFEYPTLTCTGRYSCDPSKGITNILSGMLGFKPNKEDYDNLMNVVAKVVNREYEEDNMQPEKTNDEHILNKAFEGRMYGLHCGYQYMPHVFNRHDIPWNEVYLVHSGAPKSKWFTKERFINNVGLKMPYSEYDYAMIYWYFHKLDEVVKLYNLPYEILKESSDIDMSKIPLKLPKEKPIKTKSEKTVYQKPEDDLVDLW